MQGAFRLFQKEQAADLGFIRQALLAWAGPEPSRLRGSIGDHFFEAILSARTRDGISRRAFMRLAAHYDGDWNLAAEAPESEICFLVRDVTFPEKKAACLKLVWRNNKVRNGTVGFDYLAQIPVELALRELEKNFGVGRKISAAALNFSIARGRAFVVDTHVLRLLRRFSFAGQQTQTEGVYDAVMHAAQGMDAEDLFELHWHLKRLGEKVCSHSQSACGICPLAARCLRRMQPGTRIVSNLQPRSLGHELQ